MLRSMESEIRNFISMWIQIIISLCYCYAIRNIVPKGFPTLLAILPITCLFLVLPLNLHTMHLGAVLSLFISWLANFKLLLFAFNKGPLSNPSLTLKQFVVVASFPINIHPQDFPKSQNKNAQFEKSLPKIQKKRNYKLLLINYTIKALLLAGMVKAYKFNDRIHPMALYCLYSMQIYFSLEIILAIASVLVRTLLGVELEPPFNKPYLSSSLQDFWSRRWNLAVTKIFRPAVYKPTQKLAERVIGPKWATLPAIFMTFLVSGLIHELIFYYLGRVRPTWEITQFFILHGICLIIEVCFKKKYCTKHKLPRIVSQLLTVGFILTTASWLFYPQLLLQCNGQQRAFEEYAALGMFLQNVFRVWMQWINELIKLLLSYTIFSQKK